MKKINDENSNYSDANAICSILWMIGAYGESIPSAPYIIEPLIDRYDELEDKVRLVGLDVYTYVTILNY